MPIIVPAIACISCYLLAPQRLNQLEQLYRAQMDFIVMFRHYHTDKMIVIGTAQYNAVHRVELLWDNRAKGKKRIMARAFNQPGYFPASENFFYTIKEAVEDIPEDFFTKLEIFPEYAKKT